MTDNQVLTAATGIVCKFSDKIGLSENEYLVYEQACMTAEHLLKKFRKREVVNDECEDIEGK